MAYKHCRFCKGNGCITCEIEASKDRDLKGEVESRLPEPLLSVNPDDPEDVELLVSVFHRDAIEFAFQEDVDPMETALTGRGGGMRTISHKALMARLIQSIRIARKEDDES